jgi:6-phosphogluconolactonase
MNKIKIKKFLSFKEMSLQCCERIAEIVIKKKIRSLVFPGGSSPKILFKYLSKKNIFKKCKVILSDERLTKNKNKNNSQILLKNFSLLKKVNFLDVLKKKNNFLKNYDNALPKKLELCILGMGDDGHVASVFNNELSFNFSEKLLIAKKRNENFFRISLSCKYISSAKKIILLASNKKKLGLIIKKRSKQILQIAKMHKKQIECFACVS